MISKEALYHGYYFYNGKMYLQKQMAFDAAIIAKDFSPDIKFIFNDDVFGEINWEEEPSQSLRELYVERAKQLRDKYDYLVLMYSGGADSTEVLHTFDYAGIPIDEIQTYWPLSLIRQDAMPSRDDPEGFLYEYNLAAYPRIKDYVSRHQKTKHFTVDMTHFVRDAVKENTMADNLHTLRLYGGLYHDFKTFQQINEIDKLKFGVGAKKVGVIYACSMVIPRLIDNVLMFMFTDNARTNGVVYPYLYRGEPSHSTEMFFWSREAPYIPVKQLHMVKQELEHNPQFLADMVAHTSQVKDLAVRYRYDYELRMQKLLYYSFDAMRYQTRVRRKETDVLHALFPNGELKSILDAKNKLFTDKYAKIEGSTLTWGLKSMEKNDLISISFSRPYTAGKLEFKYAAQAS